MQQPKQNGQLDVIQSKDNDRDLVSMKDVNQLKDSKEIVSPFMDIFLNYFIFC